VDSELSVAAPPRVVYRVARGLDPFEPPDWSYAGDDRTFGNRFDDPGAGRGIPEAERFHMIYCATLRAAAFGETIARFRPDLELLTKLEDIEDDEPLGPDLRGGVIPEEWRLSRSLGATQLDEALRFVDVDATQTLQVLRRELASVAAAVGLSDIDLGAVAGPNRLLTQEIARYVYEQHDPTGQPLYAGVRYLSHLNPEWELWAIFADRIKHSPREVTESIRVEDPDLLEAASLLSLKIE
jgi:RES domain